MFGDIFHGRMTGHAPLNEVYKYASRVLFPGSMVLVITRCRYATLAEMARNAGDLALRDMGKRRTRLLLLRGLGLVRYKSHLKRWELTAEGWRLLVDSETAWRIENDPALPAEWRKAAGDCAIVA